jgi:hypothetical protein
MKVKLKDVLVSDEVSRTIDKGLEKAVRRAFTTTKPTRNQRRVVKNTVKKTVNKTKGQTKMAYPYKWQHQPKDSDILYPQNEMKRVVGVHNEISFKDRVKELEKDPRYAPLIRKLQKKFKGLLKLSDRPNFKWVPISKVVIDLDIQRDIIIDHLFEILDNFHPWRISPVFAVKDPGVEKYHACDGQHNTTAQEVLYAAAIWADMTDEDILIPVWYVETSDRSFARDLFTFVNGKGRRNVDEYTMVRNGVYKVRIDGKTAKDDEDAWEAHIKVQTLEKNNGTLVKKNDTENRGLAGAYTNVAAVMERSEKLLDHISAEHDLYYPEEPLHANEFGFFEAFYKEFIETKIYKDRNDPQFRDFMDEIMGTLRKGFFTQKNLYTQKIKAWEAHYKSKHGQTVDVPEPPDNVSAGLVCRAYVRKGGTHKVLEIADTGILAKPDIYDYLESHILERFN